MALVPFDVAKKHLRVDDDYQDDVITRMLEQASDIVLDYLKKAIQIVTVSAEDPALVTTFTPHKLITGDTVRIAGVAGVTPDLDGSHVVTVDEDADDPVRTFTIPVVVTVEGTGGRVHTDPGWSDGTVPVPGEVEAGTLLVLAHLFYHRGDDMKTDENLWKALERVLMRRRDPALA